MSQSLPPLPGCAALYARTHCLTSSFVGAPAGRTHDAPAPSTKPGSHEHTAVPLASTHAVLCGSTHGLGLHAPGGGSIPWCTVLLHAAGSHIVRASVVMWS